MSAMRASSDPKAMPLSTQKTALNWPHIEQASLHQFKDGGMGPQSPKQGSLPAIRTKSVSPLQSTNSGEPPLFTTHLLTKDIGANLLVEEQKFIDPFFHVFNVTFSVLPGTRHCCRSSGQSTEQDGFLSALWMCRVCVLEDEKDQNRLPQNMPLWLTDYFELFCLKSGYKFSSPLTHTSRSKRALIN